MIATRLMGGLGNQMFQYATARTVALRRQTEVVLDLGWYAHEGRHAYTKRFVELDPFQINARQVVIPASRLSLWEGKRAGLRRLLTAPAPGTPALQVLRKPDEDMAFHPEVLDAPDDTLLIGFWQSEKYFEEASDQIRADFSFRKPPMGKNRETARAAGEGDSVSIHIRRQDYVNVPLHAQTHGALDLSYYQGAVSFVEGKISKPHFFIFSDDPAWAAENLKLAHPTTYVTGNQQRNYEDLRLMTLCQHHIIANSSFSWWGAWLGANSDKVVVAPRKWFNDPSIDTSDLIPETWHQL